MKALLLVLAFAGVQSRPLPCRVELVCVVELCDGRVYRPGAACGSPPACVAWRRELVCR